MSEFFVAYRKSDVYTVLMTTLRDFMTNRETEIKATIKALRSELADLKLAKSALESSENDSSSRKSAATNTRTIKEMIRDVLNASNDGLTSTEILAAINAVPDQHVERTSLSPQLSRMKEQGEVQLVDNSWFLAGQKNSDPTVQDEEAVHAISSENTTNTMTYGTYERSVEELDPDVPF